MLSRQGIISSRTPVIQRRHYPTHESMPFSLLSNNGSIDQWPSQWWLLWLSPNAAKCLITSLCILSISPWLLISNIYIILMQSYAWKREFSCETIFAVCFKPNIISLSQTIAQLIFDEDPIFARFHSEIQEINQPVPVFMEPIIAYHEDTHWENVSTGTVGAPEEKCRMQLTRRRLEWCEGALALPWEWVPLQMLHHEHLPLLTPALAQAIRKVKVKEKTLEMKGKASG